MIEDYKGQIITILQQSGESVTDEVRMRVINEQLLANSRIPSPSPHWAREWDTVPSYGQSSLDKRSTL